MKFIANLYFCCMNVNELDNLIETCSIEQGFLDYGAVPYRKMLLETDRIENWLDRSYNAGMDYMKRNLEIRKDPALLMKETKSIMCFLAPYKPEKEQEDDFPKIASYAYGADYHKVVKDKLYLIVEKMKTLVPEMKARIFVDSAPVMEREWAKEAGLGFIGRNNFLISKKHGLHTFIGIILVSETLKYSEKEVNNGCGKCSSCIDACPTGALAEPYTLDSRKCISYQTIESKLNYASEEFVIDRKDWIFGCDICLKACPWSQKNQTKVWREFNPLYYKTQDKSILTFTKQDWKSIDSEKFSEIFENSPLKRAGINKIHDNLGV